MIHDIENEYDHDENNKHIENENNHDEPIGRRRRQISMPNYLADNYVLGYNNIDNMNVDYCYKMCMTKEPRQESLDL